MSQDENRKFVTQVFENDPHACDLVDDLTVSYYDVTMKIDIFDVIKKGDTFSSVTIAYEEGVMEFYKTADEDEKPLSLRFIPAFVRTTQETT